jgi:hypothetical protein
MRTGIRKREVALVARVQAAESERREAAARDGLRRIQELYTPLHPSIYSTRPTVVAAAAAAGAGAAADAELLCVVPSEVSEPADGVLVFRIMSPSFASAVWQEMEHYVQQAEESRQQQQQQQQQQQGGGCQLPLHRRYDHNVSMLEACGFMPLLEALNDAVQPLLPRLSLDPPCTSAAHAVRLNNFYGNEEAAKLALKVHQDKYRLTLNVCLHTTGDLDGSTVSFFQSAEDSSKSRPLKAGSVYTPEEADTVYKHSHEVGFAVLHSAKSWHKTDPILAGERGSLILWSE